MSNGPPLQNNDQRTSQLTESEADFIMTKYLLPVHRNDVNIIRFIQCYLACRHPKQAAEEAGLGSPARSAKALLERKDISECIDQLTNLSLHKYGFDANQIVERVKEIADYNIFDILNEDGTVKDKSQIAKEIQRVVKNIEVKEIWETDPNGQPVFDAHGNRVKRGRIVKVDFFDKLKATELLAREKDIFKDTKVVKHDVSQNMAQVLLGQVQKGRDRAAQVANAPAPIAIEYKDVTPQGPPLQQKDDE